MSRLRSVARDVSKFAREVWREILAICRHELPHAPRYLWRKATHPITTIKIILRNYLWILRHFPPWLLGTFWPWVIRSLMSIVLRRYWIRYERARDARTVRRRQRRRALTCEGLRMPAHVESAFLTKLPGEIRELIYHFYFEERKLLVIPVKRNLWIKAVAFPIQTKTGEQCGSENEGLQSIKGGMLDLSLTCKQIYAETIDSMYASATFCFTHCYVSMPPLPNQVFFQHVGHMMAFQRQILPQRWRSIRSIEYDPAWGKFLALGGWQVSIPEVKQTICGEYSFGDYLWPQFCATLDSMPGLERIVITHAHLGLELKHLHALLAIRGPFQLFDVYVSPREDMVDNFETELATAQFRLILPNGDCFTHDPSNGIIGYDGRRRSRRACEFVIQG